MPEFLQSGNPQLARNIIENELSNVQSTPQEKEEPAQVDAGYDDDCCNQILQGYLSGFAPGDFDQESIDQLNNADCETLLSWLGSSAAEPFDPDHPDRTWRDVYNECAAGKMSHGDIITGDPMDLAWRLLKHG